jgi:1-acyl-sn-glycerol-3-phosphate acyltransferase
MFGSQSPAIPSGVGVGVGREGLEGQRLLGEKLDDAHGGGGGDPGHAEEGSAFPGRFCVPRKVLRSPEGSAFPAPDPPVPAPPPCMNAVRSALIWSAIVGLVVGWLPLMVVSRLLDRDPARYRTGYLFRRLGAAMTRVNPYWDVRLEGDFPSNPRRPYVVVSNHQSLGDIPVVSRLPWEMKWVAKAELWRLPVAGWMLRLAGDIPVRRDDPASRAAVLPRAAAVLRNRCSVMFFPEGTRSRDGRVRRFQAGAFRLAIEAGVPVLPLAVDGTREAIPKHGWKFGRKIVARVGVLPPVETAGRQPEDAAALAEEVRQRIVARIAAWRGVHPADVDAEAAPAEAEAAPAEAAGASAEAAPAPAEAGGEEEWAKSRQSVGLRSAEG